MLKFTDWLLARLSEPSTWTGIATIIGSMHFWPESATVASAMPSIGMGVAGILGVIIAEGKK